MLRTRLFLLPLALCLISPLQSFAATTFYIDATQGSDTSTGTTPEQAWSSLAKVNDHKFTPGDQILFHAGQSWTGTLTPHGSGATGSPITVSSYGDGAKPLLKGEGAGETIMLNEISYWTLRGLAVTNHGKTVGIRNGIMIHVSAAGVASGISLIDVAVSDVNGEVGSKSSGGIGIMAWGKNGKPAHFDGLLIDHCTVEHVDGQGIWFHIKHDGGSSDPDDDIETKQLNTNVRITGTTILDTGRNAIFLRSTEAGSIDHNIIRFASARTHGNAICIVGSKDTIIRENEVSFTGVHQGGGENGAFDADDGAQGTIIEYNWSHDNNGGMANIVNDPRKHAENSGTIVRYNLSENDKARIVSFGGAVQNSMVYNNTIFVGKGIAQHLLEAGRFVSHVPGNPEGISFFNNVIYNQGSLDYDINATRVAFDANCFFGKHPSGGAKDAHIAIADFAFDKAAMPIADSIPDSIKDRKGIAIYRIPPSSTCAAPGLAIANNGGRDILGAVLSGESLTARGAVAPLPK